MILEILDKHDSPSCEWGADRVEAHEKLADCLVKELAKEDIYCIECFNWAEANRKLETENAELRKQLENARTFHAKTENK